MSCVTLIATLIFSQSLSGAQILARAQHAYDSVKTFEETISSTMNNTGGTAHVYFQRPGRLAASGKSTFGGKYAVVSDSGSTYVFNVGAWSTARSAEMGIATVTGVSGNAAMAVPAALVHASFGNILKFPGPFAVKLSQMGGRRAYALHSEKPFPMTIWVDSSNFMLMKTSTTISMGSMKETITVKFDPPKINRPLPADAFKHS